MLLTPHGSSNAGRCSSTTVTQQQRGPQSQTQNFQKRFVQNSLKNTNKNEV